MKKIIGLFLLVGAMVACSKNDDASVNDIPEAMGVVTIAATPQTTITTRAQVDLSTFGVDLPQANGSDMVLTITPPAGGYVEVPDAPFSFKGTVGEYNGPDNRDARKRYLPASSEPYRASLTWGNAESEGINAPYFESRNADGDAEQGFTVTERTNTEIALTARMVKAIVRIDFTDAFRGYFANGAEMILTTAAGATFEVGYNADGTEENILMPFFVLAGDDKSFSISGKATKQRPAANVEPVTVVFSPVGRNGAAGQKVGEQMMYSYTFDVADANNVTVTVAVTNEPVQEIVVGTTELNDDSVMN